MHVDTRSLSPPTRVGKMLDGVSSRSPSTKQSQSPPVEREASSWTYNMFMHFLSHFNYASNYIHFMKYFLQYSVYAKITIVVAFYRIGTRHFYLEDDASLCQKHHKATYYLIYWDCMYFPFLSGVTMPKTCHQMSKEHTPVMVCALRFSHVHNEMPNSIYRIHM